MINKIHITGLTDKGRKDPRLAEAFKEMMKAVEDDQNRNDESN